MVKMTPSVSEMIIAKKLNAVWSLKKSKWIGDLIEHTYELRDGVLDPLHSVKVNSDLRKYSRLKPILNKLNSLE